MPSAEIVQIGSIVFLILVIDALLRERALGETRLREEELVAAFLLLTVLILSKYT